MASSHPSAPPDENAIQPADNNVNSSPTTSKVAASQAQPTMSDVMEEKKHEYEDRWISGMQLWLLMMPLCFTFFLVLLDISIIATAIPQITNDFRSLPDVGWYGASYQLASAALQPLTGKFYVNFKNKWTYITFFGLFELGSLICGVASSSEMLIVGRAIQGMGTAGLQNGAFTIIAAAVPLSQRPALVGLCQGVAQLGGVIGPLVGGALTQYTTWRWCFYINLPPGALVAAILFMTEVPDGEVVKPPAMEVVKDLHNKLDLLGFVLFAPSVIMLLMAVQWGGNEYAWDSSTVIGLFCGFAGNFLVWAIWNHRKGDKALIPFSMVANLTVWTSFLFLGILMGSMFVAVYYLPIYFQAVDGVTPTMSGVYMLPSILTQLFSAVLAGRLVVKVGRYLPFALGSAVLMSVGYGLCSTLGTASTTGEWVGYQILFGVGRGLGFQMPIVAVQHALPAAQAPLAISLLMFAGMLFGALLLSFASTVFTQSLRQLIPPARGYGVSADSVIAAGATGFRNILSPSQLGPVLVAYAKSVDRVFYLITALTAVSFFLAFGLGWRDIREKKAPEKEEDGGAEKA